MAVWLRSADGATELYPLRDSRYLMLRPLAARWKLDPAAMSVGKFGLLMDDNGSCVSTIDEIRTYSGPNGGDGLSEETALVITGKPAEEEEDEEEFDIDKAKERDLRADFTAVASLSENQFKALPYAEWRRLRYSRSRLVSERNDAMEHELYGDGGIYHYSRVIEGFPEVEKAAEFVGTVHLIPKGVEFDPSSTTTARALASLVRPDGYCLTSGPWAKSFREEESNIFLTLPRMPSESNSHVFYECKISKIDGSVVHLEPKAAQGFKSCMATHFEREVCTPNEWTYVFSGIGMRLIKCFEAEVMHDPLEVFVLPTTSIEIQPAIGGPAFDNSGVLKGVVVSTKNRLRPDLGSGKDCIALSGRRLKKQKVSDFRSFQDRAEKWMKVNEELGSKETDCEFKDWCDALNERRLVQYATTEIPLLPCDEWCSRHPLPEFIERAVERAMAPSPRMQAYVSTCSLSQEEEESFINEQVAVRKF